MGDLAVRQAELCPVLGSFGSNLSDALAILLLRQLPKRPGQRVRSRVSAREDKIYNDVIQLRRAKRVAREEVFTYVRIGVEAGSSDVTYGDVASERRDPVNAPFQLVASLLAPLSPPRC